MIKKEREKEAAVILRKQGFSYNEILREVSVAKSTLSLWLREVGLGKKQKQRLTLKKLDAARRGAEANKKARREIARQIKEKARAEIQHISKKELWLMGIMLHWAEGSKEKPDSRPVGVRFSNSNPQMVRLYVKWLTDICKVPRNQIKYELYIHENNKDRLDTVKRHWISSLGLGGKNFQKVYFKKHKLGTKRRNVGSQYYGLIRVCISRSSSLNRRIAGWIDGINRYYWGIG